ncbi:uncharacterized protein [Rutidosis leptorrhynchoides]|uniref:uncharacterized protein n=1 Tax=Rutidosis leptorrhynchoides TaxID=125765 RepID=UPI003A99EE3B
MGIQHSILQILPFSIGKLPMKYLGVPLLAKRLGVKDAKCLVDKVKMRINNWRNKHLSYAGRLQLIAAVLSSMQIYWASVYKIPLETVKDIEKALKGFLWNKGDSSKGKAKVVWKVVCTPKDQGGLGIKPLGDWNDVLLVKQLWKIIIKKESLWFNSVNVVKLKGRSIWEIQHDQKDSGVGSGPLAAFISRRVRYEAKLDDDLSLHSIIENNKWKWPVEWVLNFPLLQNLQPPLILDRKDNFLWLTNDGKKVSYSSKQTWADLRNNMPAVPWHRVIWFPQANPKHAFIIDSIDHLFFQCGYALNVWRKMKLMLLYRGLPNKFHEVVSCLMIFSSSKQIWNVVNRLMMAATVYFVWQERNWRLFKNKKINEEDLCNLVMDYMKVKLLTFKVKCTKSVIMLAQNWNLE